jgi:hypothetical protein
MTGKGKKEVMLFGQSNRWRVSSIILALPCNRGLSLNDIILDTKVQVLLILGQ